MFANEQIANPELKDAFILTIDFLVNEKQVFDIIKKKDNLFEMLIKGLLNYMTVEATCHSASDILVKLFKPFCFGEATTKFEQKDTILNVTSDFFKSHPKIFTDFMDSYNKMMNKIMTDYIMSLAEINKNNNRTSQSRDAEYQEATVKKAKLSFGFLCDLIKIVEFLLMAYPKDFFNVENLNCSRLISFLKNVSSRILENSYFEKYMQTFKDRKGLDTIFKLAKSFVGIFLIMDNNKILENDCKFIDKLLITGDFDIDPLNNINKIFELKEEEEASKSEGLMQFKSIIEKLKKLKPNKAEKKMSEKEWEDVVKDNKCIICYVNISDRKILPCNHSK